MHCHTTVEKPNLRLVNWTETRITWKKQNNSIKNNKTFRLKPAVLQCLHEYSELPPLIKLIIFMHIHTCAPLFHISRDYCSDFDWLLFAIAGWKWITAVLRGSYWLPAAFMCFFVKTFSTVKVRLSNLTQANSAGSPHIYDACCIYFPATI